MKRTLIAATIGAAFMATGCAVHPVAIDDAAQARRAADDQRRLFDEQEPVTAPLTMADAVARALKYNMEYRTRLMEEAAAMGQTQLANFDMLPRLTAAAGYSWRNNDAFGYGFTPAGTISTVPSAASDRSHNTNSLTYSWNVLDFGLSYVRAKQLADQSLVAEERRRKAQQNLVQDVRNAWWHAEAAQRLLPEMDRLQSEVDQATARARLIETRRLLPPLQIVAYRRSLLDLQQQLSLRRQELEQARIDLASLIGLRPGQEFSLAAPAERHEAPPDFVARADELEALALANRPELREEGYRGRITELEGKKQLLALLPSLGFDVGTNYDSNRYLVNNRWLSAGTNVSWNLLKVFSYPAVKEANRAAATVDETRRLAVTAAVLAQTRMATARYALLNQELTIWDDAVADDERIVGYLGSAKQVGLETELELIRARARMMISKVNRDLVYANLQGAVGRIYNSVGIDALPLEVESHRADALAKALDERLQQWEQANFRAPAAIEPQPVAVAAVSGLKGKDAKAFGEALQRILRLSKIAVAGAGDQAPYRLETTVALQPVTESGQQVKMTVRLLGENGAVLSETQQSSMLVPPVDTNQWRALGEGAAYRVVTPLRAAYAAQRTHAAESAATAPARFSLPPADTGVPDAAALRTGSDDLKQHLSHTLSVTPGVASSK